MLELQVQAEIESAVVVVVLWHLCAQANLDSVPAGACLLTVCLLRSPLREIIREGVVSSG